MRPLLASLEAEYRRHQALGDAAMAQLTDEELNARGADQSNSVAMVAWHLGGNLRSRFTDFLAADGEKTWRDRETEFDPRARTRPELTAHWERGWRALFEALAPLSDADLPQTIVIRGVELKVYEALHRSLAHAGYHVGQMVYIAKGWRGPRWRYLSIPPGGSEAYNRNPVSERAEAHAAGLSARGRAEAGAAIAGIDHVQLAMPGGREDEARRFYAGLLGLPEKPKPPELGRRGGVWFENAAVKIHLGVEADFRPARKAPAALRVRGLRRLVERLQEAGVDVIEDELDGYDRVCAADPFGNRLELMEPLD